MRSDNGHHCQDGHHGQDGLHGRDGHHGQYGHLGGDRFIEVSNGHFSGAMGW